MPYPVELSMFDYSQLYLPVQVLRDASIDYVLGIESIYEMAELETETNDLSKNIIFLEENDGILNPGEIQKVDGVYEIRISLTFCQFMWAVGLFMSTVLIRLYPLKIYQKKRDGDY